jgi:regulator of protease activity HflC (stomatin/prohibitin superfamily)
VITNDAKEVAVKAVVKYSIKDVVAYSENIYDAKDAISDLTQGFIAEVVNSKSWEECRDTKKLSSNITTKVRAGVKKYGIEIEAVTITDFVKTPSFRMFGDVNTEKLF